MFNFEKQNSLNQNNKEQLPNLRQIDRRHRTSRGYLMATMAALMLSGYAEQAEAASKFLTGLGGFVHDVAVRAQELDSHRRGGTIRREEIGRRGKEEVRDVLRTKEEERQINRNEQILLDRYVELQTEMDEMESRLCANDSTYLSAWYVRQLDNLNVHFDQQVHADPANAAQINAMREGATRVLKADRDLKKARLTQKLAELGDGGEKTLRNEAQIIKNRMAEIEREMRQIEQQTKRSREEMLRLRDGLRERSIDRLTR